MKDHHSSYLQNLSLLAIYHNDCMYLAHECLTLGRQKLYPLTERLLSTLGTDDKAAKLLNLRGLASVSTLQLANPLRQAGTAALLEHLRAQRESIDEKFKLARGLKVRRLFEHCEIKRLLAMC